MEVGAENSKRTVPHFQSKKTSKGLPRSAEQTTGSHWWFVDYVFLKRLVTRLSILKN